MKFEPLKPNPDEVEAMRMMNQMRDDFDKAFAEAYGITYDKSRKKIELPGFDMRYKELDK